MSINYLHLSLDDLRTHPQRVEALANIRDRMGALKAQYESIKVQAADVTPVQGGTCQVEDRLINNIVERERLALNYRAIKPMINIVERGLAAISEEQREILLAFAQAGRNNKGIADRLAIEHNMDRSTVYRLLRIAQHDFTVYCYGIVEL